MKIAFVFRWQPFQCGGFCSMLSHCTAQCLTIGELITKRMFRLINRLFVCTQSVVFGYSYCFYLSLLHYSRCCSTIIHFITNWSLFFSFLYFQLFVCTFSFWLPSFGWTQCASIFGGHSGEYFLIFWSIKKLFFAIHAQFRVSCLRWVKGERLKFKILWVESFRPMFQIFSMSLLIIDDINPPSPLVRLLPRRRSGAKSKTFENRWLIGTLKAQFEFRKISWYWLTHNSRNLLVNAFKSQIMTQLKIEKCAIDLILILKPNTCHKIKPNCYTYHYA